jgi:hypothetical protein
MLFPQFVDMFATEARFEQGLQEALKARAHSFAHSHSLTQPSFSLSLASMTVP